MSAAAVPTPAAPAPAPAPDKDPPMDLQAASRQARVMGSFFRAFGQLEEIITAAAEAEERLKTAPTQMAEIRAELARLTAERAAAEQDRQVAVAAQGAVRVELEHLKDAVLVQRTHLANERTQALQALEVEVTAERATLQKDTDVERARLDQEMVGLRRRLQGEISQLEDKKKRAEEALAAISALVGTKLSAG